jgi:hypothetical protein
MCANESNRLQPLTVNIEESGRRTRMFNRMSALCLAVGLIGGYALGGPVITAQGSAADPRPPFVSSGDEVALQFERGTYEEHVRTIRCNVAEIQGTWIRCAADRLEIQPDQKWYSLQYVVQITEREKM